MTNLSKKEKGFVKDYVRTGNGTQSVLNNYNVNSENSAAALASQSLRKIKIQNAIKSIAECIPDELMVDKHLSLLNKIDKEGDIDVQAVKAGLDMGYKLKGAYVDKSGDALEKIAAIINVTAFR